MEWHQRLDRRRSGTSQSDAATIRHGHLEDYTKEGWDVNDVQEYLTAYGENYSNPKMLPRIPGTFEYWKSLDTHLSEAMTGQLNPQRPWTARRRIGARSRSG